MVLRVDGRMDAVSCNTFGEACDRAIKEGVLWLVADLGALRYISSAGIGTLVRLAITLRQKNGEIVLCGVNGLVRDVLQVTRTHALFRVFESPEEAVEGFR